jgi:Ca2+-binding EF-hand superfamily protein
MLKRENSDHVFFVFAKYDTDKSGSMSRAELLQLLKDYEFGYKFSKEEAEMAVDLLAKSGQEEISYQDFRSWWISDNRFSLLQW